MAWRLMFSTAGMVHGFGLEPVPSEIASGIGVSMCVASCSPDSDLSRRTAQPAVLIASTSGPDF